MGELARIMGPGRNHRAHERRHAVRQRTTGGTAAHHGLILDGVTGRGYSLAAFAYSEYVLHVQPVLISHTSAVNCLGDTSRALLSALAGNQSGLRHCDFDDVTLNTFIGRVPELEQVHLREDLARYDCRNNRLAQFALEQDGFAQGVAAARDKYGA